MNWDVDPQASYSFDESVFKLKFVTDGMGLNSVSGILGLTTFQLSITDSSGNTIVWEVNLTVVDICDTSRLIEDTITTESFEY